MQRVVDLGEVVLRVQAVERGEDRCFVGQSLDGVDQGLQRRRRSRRVERVEIDRRCLLVGRQRAGKQIEQACRLPQQPQLVVSKFIDCQAEIDGRRIDGDRSAGERCRRHGDERRSRQARQIDDVDGDLAGEVGGAVHR